MAAHFFKGWHGHKCDHKPYIYAGVVAGVVGITRGIINGPAEHNNGHFGNDDKKLGPTGHAILILFVAADLPFSFAADTIILPYSIYKQIEVCV